ncbi:hypothetical protein EHQ92_06515 [Leptospira biflexa]|uniref:hypothetical protein n=1 Tax=Leptospira biflexa TaxID=172 RepID=UPI0010911BCC|nr:hypothetical protein [Leptospira biflexa]TGM47560.1 hypothetical protein EHQ92_06515 [Leptospira biflexa]TGM49974.1 hypothetical protein EHQ88_06570 [Leptospira biflexa]
MKRKSLILLTLILLIVVHCRKKTEEILLPEKLYIIPFANNTVSIYHSLDTLERVSAFEKDKYWVVSGILKLVPKNQGDKVISFLFGDCDSRFKCTDGKFYIKLNTIQYNADAGLDLQTNLVAPFSPVYIAKKDQVDSIIEGIQFYNQPSSEYPSKGLSDSFVDHMIQVNKSLAYHDKNEFLIPFYVLQRMIVTKGNVNFPELDLTTYKISSTLQSLMDAKKNGDLSSFVFPTPVSDKQMKVLEELVEETRKERIFNLMNVEKSWQTIQREYKELGIVPDAKQKVLESILKTAEYKVVGREGITQINGIDSKQENGVKLQKNKTTGNLEIVSSNTALNTFEIAQSEILPNTEDSVKLRLTSPTGEELNLESMGIPKAFKGAETLKEYVKNIPKTIDEIQSNANNVQQAAMNAALRFGVGKFDREAGKYIYEIQNVNVVLALFKNNSVFNASDSEYSQEVSSRFGETIITKFYQKYDKATKVQTLFLNYENEGCARECSTYPVPDNLCFTTGDSLIVKFTPSDLEALSEVDVKFSAAKSEYCNYPFGNPE